MQFQTPHAAKAELQDQELVDRRGNLHGTGADTDKPFFLNVGDLPAHVRGKRLDKGLGVVGVDPAVIA